MEDQKKDEKQESIPTEEQAPDSDECLIKHPLQNIWTLWYYEPKKNTSYEENQHDVFTFSTIEDFWSLINHIKSASELRVGCDYALFKKGIRPLWEDEANRQGGRWLMSVDKKPKDTDKYWLEVMLCMIGEAFDAYSEEVCGAVINVRPKKDKIALWTADFHQSEHNLEIGRKLRERLQIPRTVVLGYQSHADTEKSGSSGKFTFQA